MLAPAPGSRTFGLPEVTLVWLVSLELVSSALSEAEDRDGAGHDDDPSDDEPEGAELALALDLPGGRPLRLEAYQPAFILALSLLAGHGGER